jgi:release factor glutamine methyltransferase
MNKPGVDGAGAAVSPGAGGRETENVDAALAAGRTKFMGLELLVAPGALVPRAETELLGNHAVLRLKTMQPNVETGTELRAIDMCCGAGNLACAIAMGVPAVRVWCSDLTDGCVAVARTNIDHLGLAPRVTLKQGDLFAPLAGLGLEETIHVIACNPPYISTGRLTKDRASLLDKEPREAFDGGPYGLSIHQRVIKDAPAFLRPGGWLMMEFGVGQEKQVKLLFDRSKIFSDVSFATNEAGEPRVVLARK